MPTQDIFNKVFKLGTHRTHVCADINQLTGSDEVCLEGWVWRLREMGGLTFFELRDRYGAVQCVSEAKLEVNLHRFDVVRVNGLVRPRPKDAVRDESQRNEVVVSAVKVLNATQPLPYSMDEAGALENTKLKYRYLDIRNPQMWRRLKFRSDVYAFTRDFFHQRDFLEIETPVLYKSTPEGARDFLVPSRLYQGQFYALPQSPQTLKQLLMIGGVDRYFQIVKCFRDEDLRKNRQPEFTQLDIECAFVSEEEVMDLMESFATTLLTHFKCELPSGRLPRITYHDAMNRYGTDAPDLRYTQLQFKSLKPIFEKHPFEPFKSLLAHADADVVCVCVPKAVLTEAPSRSVLSKLEAAVKEAGAGGMLWVIPEGESSDQVKSNAKKYFTPEVLADLSTTCGEFGAAFILAGDKHRFAYMHVLRMALIETLKIQSEVPYALCWVHNFPMFVEHEDFGVSYNHHPFTSPTKDAIEKMMSGQSLTKEDILSIPARAYDLVLNGQEIGGGSIRIHQPDVQLKVFQMLNISEEDIKEMFGFFLEALGYGAPPHGGIALGMDRLVAVMDGSETIRDYIAFPKTQNAQCLMSNAPSEVHSEQLTELGIQIAKK